MQNPDSVELVLYLRLKFKITPATVKKKKFLFCDSTMLDEIALRAVFGISGPEATNSEQDFVSTNQMSIRSTQLRTDRS